MITLDSKNSDSKYNCFFEMLNYSKLADLCKCWENCIMLWCIISWLLLCNNGLVDGRGPYIFRIP